MTGEGGRSYSSILQKTAIDSYYGVLQKTVIEREKKGGGAKMGKKISRRVSSRRPYLLLAFARSYLLLPVSPK